MAERYKVYLPLPGYYTSLDCMNENDPRCMVQAGEYYVYNRAGTAVAIGPEEGSIEGGAWISDTLNQENANANTSTDDDQNSADPSNTDTTSGYYSDVQEEDKPAKNPKASHYVTVEYTAYIKNLVTGTTIELELPQEVTDQIATDFDDIVIRGRSAPLRGYSASGPRTVSFDLELHEDYCPYGLVNTCAQLKALCYPGYDSNVNAPQCYVRIGQAVTGIFTVSDVSVTYQTPYRDDMYVFANVSISLTEAGDVVRSAAEVEAGGGMTS